MNTKQAYFALLVGEKLTRNDWGPGEYIYMDSNGFIWTNTYDHYYMPNDKTYKYVTYKEPNRPRLLYRRPVKNSHNCWFIKLPWYESKEKFMKCNQGQESYGPWEIREEPEECEE